LASVGQDKAAFAHYVAIGFFLFFGNAAPACVRLLGIGNAVQQVKGSEHNEDCKEFHFKLIFICF
jgi:hypothetical protein